MQVEIAAHNYGWNPGLLDVKIYLQASSVRFYKAYQSFVGRGDVQTVCDVGGFWGVFSITLKELGYDVDVTSWAAIGAPAGVDKAKLKIFNDAFKEAHSHPDVMAFFKKRNAYVPYRSGPETRERRSPAGEL